jgi:hypothetical protein
LRGVDGREHLVQFFARQYRHLAARYLGQLDLLGRERLYVILRQVLEHRAQRDEVVLLRLDVQRYALALHVQAVEVQPVVAHQVPVDFPYIQRRLGKRLEALEVVPVVLQRLAALVLADLAVREEVVDGVLELHAEKYIERSMKRYIDTDDLRIENIVHILNIASAVNHVFSQAQLRASYACFNRIFICFIQISNIAITHVFKVTQS